MKPDRVAYVQRGNGPTICRRKDDSDSDESERVRNRIELRRYGEGIPSAKTPAAEVRGLHRSKAEY